DIVKTNRWVSPIDLDPNEIILQIKSQFSEKSLQWSGAIYVPNQIKVSVPAANPKKLEEVEVIFNSTFFVECLYKYINALRYRQFDFFKIEVEPMAMGTGLQQSNRCFIELSWPGPALASEGVSVQPDMANRRVVEVFAPRPEIGRLARLRVLNASVYRNDYIVTKRITYIGRLRNITDKTTGSVIRRNDFVFTRHNDPDSPNNSVSRKHATILFRNSEFYLLDSISANGTKIERNEGRTEIIVSPSQTHGVQLAYGDVIIFGSARVSFEKATEEDLATFVNSRDRETSETHGDFFFSEKTVRITRSLIDKELKK
ncbi:MAG: FHA domain-containing protein, partial [Acidobacteriota bacterium]